MGINKENSVIILKDISVIRKLIFCAFFINCVAFFLIREIMVQSGGMDLSLFS